MRERSEKRSSLSKDTNFSVKHCLKSQKYKMMKNISLWLPGRPGVGVRGRLTFLKKSEARAPERPGVQSESAWVLTVLEIQKGGRHLLTFLEIEKDGRCGSAQTQRRNASFKNKKPTRLICILIIMSIDAPEVVC